MRVSANYKIVELNMGSSSGTDPLVPLNHRRYGSPYGLPQFRRNFLRLSSYVQPERDFLLRVAQRVFEDFQGLRHL